MKLFQQYWRRFLAFWLVPVFTMAGVVLGDILEVSPVLRNCGLVILVPYFFVSFFFAHILYMRRELSAGQAVVLNSPFIFIWVLLVCIRAIVLCVLGRPL